MYGELASTNQRAKNVGQMIPETHSCNFPAFLESTYLTNVSTSVIAKCCDLKLFFVLLPYKLYGTITASEHRITEFKAS